MSRAAALLFLAFAACQTPPPAPEPLACTLVFLRTGPARDLDKATMQQAFAGHFANMGRMAREHDLLLAGPFGEPRHAPDLRGLFIVDTADRQRAQAIASTDPTTKAGVFVLEYHDLITTAPLRELLARELAKLEQAEQDGRKLQPGEGGRSYVLLTAENGTQAEAALAGHSAVLLRSRLDGSKAWFVLDAEECEQVPALLGEAANGIGPHVLDSWFGSGEIATVLRR